MDLESPKHILLVNVMDMESSKHILLGNVMDMESPEHWKALSIGNTNVVCTAQLITSISAGPSTNILCYSYYGANIQFHVQNSHLQVVAIPPSSRPQ